MSVEGVPRQWECHHFQGIATILRDRVAVQLPYASRRVDGRVPRELIVQSCSCLVGGTSVRSEAAKRYTLISIVRRIESMAKKPADTVFVVERENDLRARLSRYLSDSGFAVRGFSSAESFLETL